MIMSHTVMKGLMTKTEIVVNKDDLCVDKEDKVMMKL